MAKPHRKSLGARVLQKRLERPHEPPTAPRVGGEVASSAVEITWHSSPPSWRAEPPSSRAEPPPSSRAEPPPSSPAEPPPSSPAEPALDEYDIPGVHPRRWPVVVLGLSMGALGIVIGLALWRPSPKPAKKPTAATTAQTAEAAHAPPPATPPPPPPPPQPAASASAPPAPTASASASAPPAPTASASGPVASAAPAPSAAPSAEPSATAHEVAPSATALRDHALALLQEAKNPEAMAAARAARDADPTDAMPYLVLGSALQDSGKWLEAHKTYELCVKNARKGMLDECRAMLRRH